jgi:oligopeptide transport system ATP-binding protein
MSVKRFGIDGRSGTIESLDDDEIDPAPALEPGLLKVRDLTVELPSPSGYLTVVDHVNYTIGRGQVFGIAGESGSGKTVSMLAIMGLLPRGAKVSGRAFFQGLDLLALPGPRRRRLCGKEIAMVFQDPTTSLHPMLTIGRQLTDHVRYHLHMSKSDANEHACDLLRRVQIPDPPATLRSYPHQFSGGMRQRIAMAIALACRPKILIADEPTTALDVTVQAGVLRLLDSLRTEMDLSVVLVTHDLGVMSAIADVVSVFYAGRVVEVGTPADLLCLPRHPYSRGLLDALPHGAGSSARPLMPIRGTSPSAALRPEGCAFNPRCEYAIDVCRSEVPPLINIGATRELACWPDPLREEHGSS